MKISDNNFLGTGLCGALSTIINEAIMTPADVVKQRLQVFNFIGFRSLYSVSCLCRVY